MSDYLPHRVVSGTLDEVATHIASLEAQVEGLSNLYANAQAERDRALSLLEQAREALGQLVSWQPHTEVGLAGLHPQHREAVEAARALLAALDKATKGEDG